MTDVHLINHTHWDREWFLTHEYTTAWVPALIDSIKKLAAENPDYDFLFDGQTLAIEDLLSLRPDYEDRVRTLVSDGQLHLGPCYSQPDWRMVSGELHVRNLQYGMRDAERLGGAPTVAWLVDTFGHISQAPQLLSQAGLDSAYVWRGVPEMEPVFWWRSPDGTRLMTIDLFGGYRNLYGISKTPEIALDRLVAETDKLAPCYGDMPVPLFDGYDLDTEPEDPYRWYGELDVPSRVALHESSPSTYAAAIRAHAEHAPEMASELLSGKFGSTFPGSLSCRTYLKVLHHDAERAMHRVIEPLVALAGERNTTVEQTTIERASRTLLQNGVHDCLCGVSIDQVHERMERSYVETLDWADRAQRELATAILDGFASGSYAISSNAMATSSVLRTADNAVRVSSEGVGVTAVVATSPIDPVNEQVERFEWSNEHYTAAVDRSGLHLDGVGQIARFVVRVDDGDTYSSEPGEIIGELTCTGGPIVVDRSDLDTSVSTNWTLESGDIDVQAQVVARFDDGPMVELTVRLDSTGVGFRVDAEFDTGIRASTVHAGMPFDVVERSMDGDDLFGPEIDPGLAAILMGQRETELVTEFPFHDFVALTDTATTRAVLARGLRSYRSSSGGTISVALRRSVEWLALTGLRYRIGDAGPAMYVPGARCERRVEHRIGFVAIDAGLDDPAFRSINEGFQNPPVLADVEDGPADGVAAPWTVFSAELPNSTVTLDDGDAVVRLFNPTSAPVALGSSRALTDFRRRSERMATQVEPGQIVTTAIDVPALPSSDQGSDVRVHGSLRSRVGPSRSQPDPKELDGLERRIADLSAEIETNTAALATSNGGADRYRLTHREYVLDRERLELALSLELNRRRAATDDLVSIPDAADPVIAELGAALNDLRVKRRIWDYVVQAMANA